MQSCTPGELARCGEPTRIALTLREKRKGPSPDFPCAFN